MQVPLTVGMSVYDDFDGAYFTIQSLRMYHKDVNQLEIFVLDTNPSSPYGQALQGLAGQTGITYVPYNNSRGTWSRFEIFKRAKYDHVVCLDSHVILEPGSLRKLSELYAQNPDTKDLYQGPMMHDDLRSFSTHLDPVWRCQFYGTWGTDSRANDPDGKPFEIQGHGLGMFSCNRRHLPQINENCYGFGGEEFYLHDKIRMNGGTCWCVPSLRWLHRFFRPAGVPYRNVLEERVRNYFIGWSETGRSISEVIDEFSPVIGSDTINQVLRSLLDQGLVKL